MAPRPVGPEQADPIRLRSRLVHMETPSPSRPVDVAFNREDLLSPDEVAEVLRLKRATTILYMRRGVIPAFKLGSRWYSVRSQLDAYVTSASRSAVL